MLTAVKLAFKCRVALTRLSKVQLFAQNKPFYVLFVSLKVYFAVSITLSPSLTGKIVSKIPITVDYIPLSSRLCRHR